ncbi:ATP-binding protein [Streptomyces sp. J2-1]|uniref:ATP-binding protein n=1 Tax=Streptomyces corallincola TaxID=2851888 RepID=UPI001C3951C9|nr:ATP-binding protein [Streptomyces corallincola]MBV2355379.1 ATP-binding protein [Streptomyces corallincola]
MLEVVALSALTAFLASVGNGVAGEMGKQLLVSTGTLVRRTTGRPAALPSAPDEQASLADFLHTRLGHDARLSDEWALLLGASRHAPGTLRRGAWLPPAPRHFTNQQKALKQLTKEAARPAAGRPRVALLYGPPGIGTTSVALNFGAAHGDRFPDGRFHVDLRDAATDGGPGPAAVLSRLLTQMGVSRDEMPSSGADRERLYRQLTDGRRALIVIDHATTLAQVRSLTPATPDVLLLVVVSGQPFALEAERVEVGPLSDRHATQLVRQLVRQTAGPENLARSDTQMPQLLRRCAGNAYALATAAAQFGTPALTAAGPAGDGQEIPHPVREAARRAAGLLPAPTARLCRLAALGGWPTLDADLAAAAAGSGTGPEEAVAMLTQAAEAGLLESVEIGTYRFRPEVRRYLTDTAGPEHGIAECSAAVHRTLDAVLLRALHAAHAALPQSWRTEAAPAEGTPYRDETEGLKVLEATAGNVIRAVSLAEEYQQPTTALRLARALWPLQLKVGRWDDILPALRVAVRVAGTHQPDTRTAGGLYFQLAHCLDQLGQRQDADRAALAAVESERAAGHPRGEASALEFQGLLSLYRWKFEEAHESFIAAGRVYATITSGQEGAADLPRALALLERHKGRALRGLGRLDESRQLLLSAIDFFKNQGEDYNRARSLTDLAETLHDTGEDAMALERITEAEGLLTPSAVPHLQYLSDLRRRCEAAR